MAFVRKGTFITEPSAVAPDARSNVSPKWVPRQGFQWNVLTDNAELDTSIRRYRARFCNDFVNPK
jgi:hypothetical protein